MTITLEPFTKMSAACDGCGRSASAAHIAGRHFSMILCASCRADLHRLTAPAAPVLTVGAALAMPEVQRGEAVVEWTKPGHATVQMRAAADMTRDDRLRWRTWRPSKVWRLWASPPYIGSDEYALPARLVSLADADRDPRERGVL